jgi:hypothetical protein
VSGDVGGIGRVRRLGRLDRGPRETDTDTDSGGGVTQSTEPTIHRAVLAPESETPGRRPGTRSGGHDSWQYTRSHFMSGEVGAIGRFVASVAAGRIDAGLREARAG